MFPMQSLQQANSSDILSLGSIFQDLCTMSRSHPSGINPSKTGNIISFEYSVSVSGIVGLMALALTDFRYSPS